MSYTATAASNVADVAVTAVPSNNAAQIGITATAGTTVKNVVNGGKAALSTGSNVIGVEVKNGNEVKVYTVTVTKAST